MNVLIIVLNKTEYLEEVLDRFTEIGVRGATILDSQGMGSKIRNTDHARFSGLGHDPFFGTIRSFLENVRPFNKTIFTVIEGEELLDKAVQSVIDIVGDISQPGVGMMFTLPVGNVYGI